MAREGYHTDGSGSEYQPLSCYIVGMRNKALSQSPVNEPHVDFVSTIVILGMSWGFTIAVSHLLTLSRRRPASSGSLTMSS